MQQIEVKGLEFLSEDEKKTADKLFKEYYEKIERKLKNFLGLKVHIKIYSPEGRKKFSLNAEAMSAGKMFEANAADWDFARTMHKLMNKVINEIEHEFHGSDQNKRLRR